MGVKRRERDQSGLACMCISLYCVVVRGGQHKNAVFWWPRTLKVIFTIWLGVAQLLQVLPQVSSVRSAKYQLQCVDRFIAQSWIFHIWRISHWHSSYWSQTAARLKSDRGVGSARFGSDMSPQTGRVCSCWMKENQHQADVQMAFKSTFVCECSCSHMCSWILSNRCEKPQ